MRSFRMVARRCFTAAVSAFRLPDIPCDGLEEPNQKIKDAAQKEFELHSLRKACWYLKFFAGLCFIGFSRFAIEFVTFEGEQRQGHQFNFASSLCVLTIVTSAWAFLRLKAAQESRISSRVLRTMSYLVTFFVVALQDDHISWISRQTPFAYARHANFEDASSYPYCGALPQWTFDAVLQLQLLGLTLFFAGNIMYFSEAVPAVCLATSAYITALHSSRRSWLDACSAWLIDARVHGGWEIDLFGIVALHAHIIIPFLIYKFLNERFMRFVFTLLEQHKKTTINERVLRYEAEHSAESVVLKAMNNRTVTDDISSIAQSHATARSSPAKLCDITKSIFCQGSDVESCDGADCLPSNYLARIEGCETPQTLDTLNANQKVLCYDSLSGNTDYVQVLHCNVRSATPKVSWLSVALSDGTSLTMTADHPVNAKLGESRQSVSASHLVAGRHSISSLRMVDLQVVDVTELETGSTHETSPVELIVRQGERYSPMVSPPGMSGSITNLSALGSADLSASPSSRLSREGARQLVRSHSSPAVVSTQPFKQTSTVPTDTTSSAENSDLVDMIVQGSADASSLGNVDGNVVTLTDFQAVKQAGFKSMGSKLHATGSCRPCSFYNCKTKHQQCSKGILCRMCHETHGALSRRQLRKYSNRPSKPESSARHDLACDEEQEGASVSGKAAVIGL